MRAWPFLAIAGLICSPPPAGAQPRLQEWRPVRGSEPALDHQRKTLIAQLRSRPQDANLHLNYGRLLAADYIGRRKADWRAAAAAYEMALELDPSLSTARLELGRFYAHVGRFKLAAQLLAEHVAVQSGDLGAFGDLGLTGLRAGDFTLAAWAARKASGSPDNETRLKSGFVLSALNLPEGAQLLQGVEGAARAAGDAVYWQNAAALSLVAAAPPKGPAYSLEGAIPQVGGTPSSQGSAAVTDWRTCDNQPALSQNSSFSQYGGNSGSIGPSPLPPLPSPCAGQQPPRMAYIEAVIVRQREETNDSRGINLLNTLQVVANGRLRLGEERPGGTATSYPNFLTISLPANGLSYFLDILDNGSLRTDVLARPSLVALDRTPSIFFSGATITVPVSGQYSGTLQEKAIGVSLAVTPTFLSDDELLLAVDAGRSFLQPEIEADLEQGIQTGTNSVTANVRMRFGETLILSGLVEREDERETSKVPGLGDIPILNLAFKNKINRKLNNQVIILLTPRQPNASGSGPADDSNFAKRYDGRLAAALRRVAQQETPEADKLDGLARAFIAADLLDKLPSSLAGTEPRP
ncbi:hypothetical protein IC614_10575 [Allosphingosinicella flava]|uniref:Type II/III secretion system secretin-like domain-containing protein n=1 Tax=Allosphingosinicella flava TaxID=2771430 RepID=A0A7T2GJ20_9SPHN|nr:hypothetical protein [Sphingosinicella flava]QPQ54756.1 hypothetical protein IC614_10575 [Sphingosinicella flava]